MAKAVIIGAGPSGIAAAIQLKRSGLDPVLLEKNEAGGLLRNAHWVENYPGFPGGISGRALVRLLEKQLRTTGVEALREEVLDLGLRRGNFCISTDARTIVTRSVVIASGTSPKKLSGPALSAEVENSLLYEVLPLLRLSGKTIAIIGAGDAAFDYALHLAPKHRRIVILGRGSREGCIPILWARCRECENITLLPNHPVKSITKTDGGFLLIHGPDKEKLRVHHLMAAVGRRPSLDFVSGELRRNMMSLKRQGRLHIVGDAKNGMFRQTAIAVGDGVRAAMEIARRMK